ncbi:MAG: hypothetical protein AAF607_11325 [Pseudomonadota bacterium]
MSAAYILVAIIGLCGAWHGRRQLGWKATVGIAAAALGVLAVGLVGGR